MRMLLLTRRYGPASESRGKQANCPRCKNFVFPKFGTPLRGVEVIQVSVSMNMHKCVSYLPPTIQVHLARDERGTFASFMVGGGDNWS